MAHRNKKNKKNNSKKGGNFNKQNSITAPYNFVPLNKEVFYPEWSNRFKKDKDGKKIHDFPVHDVPFVDGESGEIEITIKAKTPIFVKNYSKEEKAERKFCQYDGEYFIPGSSIKGALRNIAEIISFSKMKLKDRTLSYRDLNNPAYKNNAMEQKRIYMGWLYKKDGKWKIDSLGKVSDSKPRIKYDRLKEVLGEKANEIKREKEAYRKYAKLDDLSILDINDGTIVFTGTINPKDKTREFLFPNTVKDTFILEDEVINTFKEAYYIGTPNESKSWQEFFKKRFNKGENIPVFFQMKNDKILHFGLSMLYKLPYKYSIKTLLKKYVENYDDKKMDLCETIFGKEEKDIALKSRVIFSHAKATKFKLSEKTVSLPLSTPRATFYPNYLVQCQNEENKTDRHKTYDNANSVLRGFKLYPPRKNPIYKVETKNHNILTKFKPLAQDSEFRTKVRFHNLKKEELGLLLLSLTLVNEKDSYHKIGMAKAYGFGTVKIHINSLKLRNNELKLAKANKEIYEEAFISLINQKLQIDFKNHPRIEALKKLTSYTYSDKKLDFMGIKGFVNAKRPANKFCLFEVVKDGYDKSRLCNNKIKKEAKIPNHNSGFNSLADALSGMKPQKRKGIKIIRKARDK